MIDCRRYVLAIWTVGLAGCLVNPFVVRLRCVGVVGARVAVFECGLETGFASVSTAQASVVGRFTIVVSGTALDTFTIVQENISTCNHIASKTLGGRSIASQTIGVAHFTQHSSSISVLAIGAGFHTGCFAINKEIISTIVVKGTIILLTLFKMVCMSAAYAFSETK